jgi:Zn-dependent metalloprotease
MYHYHSSSCRHGLHCIIPPYILDCLGKCIDVTAEVDVSTWLGPTRRQSSKLRGLRRDFHHDANQPAAARAGGAAKGTKTRQIYDAQNKGTSALPGRLVRSEGQGASPDHAVNEAYDHSGITYDFYDQVLARNSLDDEGMPMVSSVHVGKNLNNAFWTGEQMAYGDGDGKLFTRFTRSIDVVGHELSHGVITYTADLIYENESGALNEHFADVFGMLTRQWHTKTDAASADWLVGKDIMGPAASARSLRTFKAEKAFENDPYFGTDPQPKHLRDIFKGRSDNGGVHINSGIPNHAFYLFATALKGNAWEAAGSAWYATLLQLASDAKFVDMVQASDKTVVQKYGSGSAEHKALTAAWKAVGY